MSRYWLEVLALLEPTRRTTEALEPLARERALALRISGADDALQEQGLGRGCGPHPRRRPEGAAGAVWLRGLPSARLTRAAMR